MLEYVNKVIEGDCLEVLNEIANHSIDMVLCDLPYAITQNKWDTPIDLKILWAHYERIIKPRGVIVLTSQGKFTGQIIMSNLKWFKYKIIWIKSRTTNFLNANKQPLRRHEDICVFYNKQCLYQPQKTQGLPYDIGVRRDNGSGNYGVFGARYCESKDGLRFPSDLLFFEEDHLTDWIFPKTTKLDIGFHPTQKPVSLGRWFVKTYTRPGDIVLDNACGSGSFLVAAVLEYRHFIGIDKNDHSYHIDRKKVDFVDISRKRIAKAFLERGSLFST